MTNSVSGVVVGGPLDGKMLQHNSNRHTVLVRGPLTPEPARFVDRREEEQGAYDVFSYKIVDLHGSLFWMPERASLGWLMDQLADAYWRLADLND